MTDPLRYLPLLLRLKCLLQWRSYRRDVSALVGALVGVGVLLPTALLLAVALVVCFLHFSPASGEHTLRAILLVFYLFWVSAPLLGYELYESFDVTRLFVYPLTSRQLFVGSLVSALVDLPTLFLLPIAVAILIGFSSSPLGYLLVLLHLALYLVHTLALSQGLFLAGSGLLRSRRARDLLLTLIPIAAGALYFLARHLAPRDVAGWRLLWEGINYLPSGLAARGIAAAREGDLAASLAFALFLGLVAAATVGCAAGLLDRLYRGEVPTASDVGSDATGDALGPGDVSRVGVWARLSERFPVVTAIVEKELKYLARDPYFKATLTALLYLVFFAAFIFAAPGASERLQRAGPAIFWVATVMLLLAELQMLFNAFGTEGAAAWLLFQFPASRRDILIGKNITLFLTLSLINLTFAAMLAFFTRAYHHVAPALVWMLLATLLFLAVGNLVSIWYPIRVIAQGWRIRQQSSGRGCLQAVLYNLTAYAAMILALPVLAALLIPAFWLPAAWLFLTIPLAAAYTAILYRWSLRLAEPLLLQRELEIIAVLTRDD
jgi:ABC-2 type transport system permease protein